jgi:hypothetical protein
MKIVAFDEIYNFLFQIIFAFEVGFQIWVVYRFFWPQDDFKSKKIELQSYRSRRKLQISYKVYLHPNS